MQKSPAPPGFFVARTRHRFASFPAKQNLPVAPLRHARDRHISLQNNHLPF
jgi:hypothetical protein